MFTQRLGPVRWTRLLDLPPSVNRLLGRWEYHSVKRVRGHHIRPAIGWRQWLLLGSPHSYYLLSPALRSKHSLLDQVAPALLSPNFPL